MLPKLVLLGGGPGSGKSTIGAVLYKQMPNSVWLEVDDLWVRSNPFRVDDATKAAVESTAGHAVANYLLAGYAHILVTWIWHRPEIVDRLVRRLHGLEYDLHLGHLLCGEETLLARFAADPTRGELRAGAMQLHRLCREMPGFKIHVDGCTPADAAARVLRAISRD